VAETPPRTRDKRYIVVRGRLWRAANANLGKRQCEALIKQLMDARRAVAAALKAKDAVQLDSARKAVHAAKVGLGERGPVWWQDGANDYNRFFVKNTPYGKWFEQFIRKPQVSVAKGRKRRGA
jgi:hypothetical protein